MPRQAASTSPERSARPSPRVCPGWRSVGTGLMVLLFGLAGLESALLAGTLWLSLTGTLAAGAAVGLIFRSGLGELNRLVDPARRAGVISTFFVAAYLGMTVPWSSSDSSPGR